MIQISKYLSLKHELLYLFRLSSQRLSVNKMHIDIVLNLK